MPMPFDTGRESTGVDAVEWAHRLVDLGAGEILITSIDREGTKLGYEIDLINRISQFVPIPVIACGGAGSIEHFKEAIRLADSPIAWIEYGNGLYLLYGDKKVDDSNEAYAKAAAMKPIRL